jgi:uncharacterized protein involved in exopolysaccharide biosynthesis
MNFLRPYFRGWIIIVGAMVLAYLVAAKYLSYVTPMYESTARLRLADLNEGVPGSNLFKDLDVFVTTQKINAEIEMLKSHVILGKALETVAFEVQIFREGNIRKTELFNDSPILITPVYWDEKQKDKDFRLWVLDLKHFSVLAPDGNIYQGVMGEELELMGCKLRVDLNKELLEQRQNLQVEDNYIFIIQSKSRLISSTLSALDVMPIDKDVPVIRITFKSSHPVKASLLPNALAEAYISDYIENKFGAANITVDFLDERIYDVGEKLSQAEQLILEFRETYGITNIAQETETILRKISQLRIQQTNLKMSLEAIRNLEEYIISGQDHFLELAPNFEAFTDLLSTELVKGIKQLQAEKKDLLLVYTEAHEKVKVIDEKLKDLTSYLTESIRNTRNNLEIKYMHLLKDVEDAEFLLIDVPEKERIMTILRREFDIFQQSYNFLNEKRIEAEIARSARMSFHRIITPASVSKTPFSPNKIIIKIVAIILGMFGGIFIIFVIHALKARVNNLDTVETTSNVPVLLTVPRHSNAGIASNWFLQAVTNTEVKGLMPPRSIIAFTGFNAREGMRYISSGFEQVLEAQGHKIFVIEMIAGENPNDHQTWELIRESENKQLMKVYGEQLRERPASEIQKELKKTARDVEYTLIRNFPINHPFTMAIMAIAQLNIVCVDTRLTPARLLHDINQLKDEFDSPGMFLAINRVGYNPSFIREVIIVVRNCYHRFKKTTLLKN